MKRHKQRMFLAVAAVLVPLAAASGSARGASAGQPVTGVDWRVDSLTADGVTRQAPAAARIRIGTDGLAAGNLGCNGFSARVTVAGDRITLGNLRTTKMACDPARMDFERALARTLTTGTLTARVADGRLTLTDGDGDLVRLSRGAPE
ncbi:META domain-containing protein [Streptomyces naphthomycinicus]|uniref:META domain-containing protein n=1 Tax=Streptomyces naphthomycinicus TaxID=2872625 RepID=UPI001CED0C30|nr:META domain-containing protein [Streptomyces sp. TML10]